LKQKVTKNSRLSQGEPYGTKKVFAAGLLQATPFRSIFSFAV